MFAGGYLRDIDVFVGLVCLVDRAGSAKHDGKSALLELTGLGGVRHHIAMRMAAQTEHQFLRGAALVLQRRRVGQNFSADGRSEEHTSELQSLMRISYAVFCLKKK